MASPSITILDLSSFITTFKKLKTDPTIKNTVSSSASPAAKTEAVPSIDWKETKLSHDIKADLPRVKKEQLRVAVEEEGHVLVISGERMKMEDVGDAVKSYYDERSYGKFCRRFRLPGNAKVEDGVLTVTVPEVDVPNKVANSLHIPALYDDIWFHTFV